MSGYVNPHIPDDMDPALEPLRVKRARAEIDQMSNFDRLIRGLPPQGNITMTMEQYAAYRLQKEEQRRPKVIDSREADR